MKVIRLKVYLALFNPCVAESSAFTLSIHKTRKGANDAIKAHRNRWIKTNNQQPYPFQKWSVSVKTLKD